MSGAARRIHWSARGTSVTSSHAQKNKQKIESMVAISATSPAQTAASASSMRTSPCSVRPVMRNTPPRHTNASNSTSGSPSRRPIAIASRSRVSRTAVSGSAKASWIRAQPCSELSSPTSARMLRNRPSHPLCTAHSPSTFPTIQDTVRAARPAAMTWRSRR
jgi:hypothetical protein